MSIEIKMLPVSCLKLHPNNPRKRYGDLTELTESVRSQGVISPLTVFPRIVGASTETGPVFTGEYYVLAGNCRLQAAKRAGLEEVPCVIREKMSDKDQMAFMLSENMARKDLTPLEEADGIEQLSLFGASDADVQKATGLSLSTIRKRRKLTEIAKKTDRKTLEEGFSRGATLEDYMRLAAIDNDTDRQNAMEHIGTSSFDQWVRTAEYHEKIRKENVQPALTALIKCGAKQIKSADLRYYMLYVDVGQYYSGAKFKPKNGVQYYYVLRADGLVVTVYTKREDQPAKAEDEAKKQQQREDLERREKKYSAHRERIVQLAKDAQDARDKFIKNFSDWDKGTEKLLCYWAVREQTNSRYSGGYFYAEAMHRLLGVALDKSHNIDRDSMDNITVKNPRKTLLLSVYALLSSSAGTNSYWIDRTVKGTHVTVYREDEATDEVYRFLADFGYEEFEEETQLRDGSLPEFYREEDDK